MIEALRLLDTELSDIILKHNVRTIIVCFPIAENIMSLQHFRHRTVNEIQSMMDRADCTNVGFFKDCLIVANSTLAPDDSNVYVYGNTEETNRDMFKLDNFSVEILNILS